MTDPVPTGTLDPAVHVGLEDGRSVLRRRRVLYATTSLVLALLVGLAVVDAAGLVDVYGVDTDHVRADGGGYQLDVRYGTLSRPALATPLEITVVRDGGFDGPVPVAISTEYLSIWDENGLDPDPASSTTDGEWLIWEFEPPPRGDTLTVSFDGRIEPAAQRGKPGRVAVLDGAGNEAVSVSFRTRVLP